MFASAARFVAFAPRAILAVAVAFCASSALAAPGHRAVGSGLGGNSPYATDAYPGFDGLDDLPKPERRTKSWFLHVSRSTPAGQYEFVKELEEAGDYKAAAKQCDALVREWPASPEAPMAQLRFAKLLARQMKEYEDAIEALDYLFDFYSKDCPYLELVEYQYQLVNLMVKERKTFLGFSFLSNRMVRQHYESIVRRAPSASYVPEAMLKIAALREDDQQYEEAVKVYATLASRYPKTAEAEEAVYRESKARMWLCRRLAYNLPRCKDTVGFLKMSLSRKPDMPQADEMKGWLTELTDYMADDAYKRAKFYDTKRRTKHAARTAWERFLAEYPESSHADEARARIEALQEPVAEAK